MFKNKVLMITGGTGSFGQSILNRFLTTEVSEIRIFSRDEKKQEEVRLKFNNAKIKFYIGDVRDFDSIYQAMKNVDYVFHAAALKQVPSCEFYPMEALKTNILGSENVMEAATQRGVRRVVMLSTDKAVYPINAMGLSKALMEKFMIAKSRMQADNETVFCATRYGNVIGSRGSVIPLFISQLKDNKSLTITDPKMTRFMMSLDESVDLVLHALNHGKQGDIFVQKSPASTVEVLAQALKELFKKNNSYQIIGTRHSEKLYESLVSREEMVKAFDEGTFYRIPSDNRDLNYSQYFVEGIQEISIHVDYTSDNARLLNVNEVKDMLSKLPFIQKELFSLD